MKERPILFSGPMVRAILEGRKTQTRRGVKPQGAILTDDMARAFGVRPPPTQNNPVIPCPYGAPGDRLWVKETHARCTGCHGVDWRADDDGQRTCRQCDSPLGNWKPSIFMRREYSRITLEIEAVRVERLQDISDYDSYREGAESMAGTITGPYCMSFNEGFRDLWQSINGPGSWDLNPWVWVISFKRIRP